MEDTSPEKGRWFEHALEWESDSEHGDRPARCLITQISGTTASALPQVCYRRVDDPGGYRPSSIDIDLFPHILRRWLTPEETDRAEREARFRQHSFIASDLR
ncbi:hypothetical protein [Nonomuraea gerenzanensis]|uniref:hypothetical protein n=1 Tax=Nonomuraea gerenzanensis TaxID=93944 RepID=UPI001CD9808C|nr:hypothetical protein [Nonomuraea gerenzanensis]UBU16288.1 hypothetical protein LCN96_15105 [Nonomuraea gerenzanensis]